MSVTPSRGGYGIPVGELAAWQPGVPGLAGVVSGPQTWPVGLASTNTCTTTITVEEVDVVAS